LYQASPYDRHEILINSISNTSSDEELIKAAKQVADKSWPEDICELAIRLAESGVVINSWTSTKTADIPSTGGPFSLSTLLCPLILAATGCYVPKLGVPGRPAGGIDCMMQIFGYRAEFSEDDLRRIISESQYAHFLSGGRFAPLDARMFALRQRHGLQSVPELATASILSKKLAVGVQQVGLDIRVAPWGNFGKNMDEAQAAAKIFQCCSTMLGLKAFTFLTDATVPYQPYLGRSESLIAMAKILDGSADGLLALHATDCLRMAVEVSSVNTIPTWHDARAMLAQHLETQGSSFQHFIDVASRTEAEHTRHVFAPYSGYFSPDIPALRGALMQAQNAYQSSAIAFPDPLGLKLLSTSGEWVENGQPLASVRASTDIWGQFSTLIESALVVSQAN